MTRNWPYPLSTIAVTQKCWEIAGVSRRMAWKVVASAVGLVRVGLTMEMMDAIWGYRWDWLSD